ncbi:MAG: 50S ribosomal protein L11 methyltransferase [Oscillospiraceae bacterium]|jgi:ribosomal protein L11 methyltransferase
MNWLELNIYTTSEGIDAVCGSLMRLGISGFVIRDSKDFEEYLSSKSGNWDYIDDDLMSLKSCETTVTVYIADNSQGADTFAAVTAELSELKKRDSSGIFGRLECDFLNVREEDWANNWKQYFKPLKIGERLLVKPSWEADTPQNEGRTILEIDPASSFGTGQHHTTRLCLELLEKHLEKGCKILDLGCGSGILSIAGVLLGAESAVAVDIEQNAVEAARENALKNNIPKNAYKTFCGNIIHDRTLEKKLGTGYDIICANIVADVLIAMSGLFGRLLAENGVLVLSGIITERQREVTDAVEENGFSVCDIHEQEGWSAVMMRKS